MKLIADLGLAAVLFASTNVDDIFVLVAFFADPKMRASQVVTGQFIGITALVGFSAVASLAALVLPQPYVGLLGFAPIAIGLKRLFDLHRPMAAEASRPARGGMLTVASVTIANGGDNIGAYIPKFAIQPLSQMALTVAVFIAMTGLWCWLAHSLVNHPVLGGHIRRWGAQVLPFVLIGLGLLILQEAHALKLVGL